MDYENKVLLDGLVAHHDQDSVWLVEDNIFITVTPQELNVLDIIFTGPCVYDSTFGDNLETLLPDEEVVDLGDLNTFIFDGRYLQALLHKRPKALELMGLSIERIQEFDFYVSCPVQQSFEAYQELWSMALELIRNGAVARLGSIKKRGFRCCLLLDLLTDKDGMVRCLSRLIQDHYVDLLRKFDLVDVEHRFLRRSCWNVYPLAWEDDELGATRPVDAEVISGLFDDEGGDENLFEIILPERFSPEELLLTSGSEERLVVNGPTPEEILQDLLSGVGLEKNYPECVGVDMIYQKMVQDEARRRFAAVAEVANV